jgi:hypothetical protein
VNFDPISICRILNEERVDYVVVGGFASVILGSPLPTEDIDVLPDRSDENLIRLASALKRLNARIRTESEAVPALIDAQFLANMPFMLNLVTDFGIVDLTFEPSGPTRGFADWNADASSEVIADGLVIRVASLDDIIESKRAADREKDRRALPYLESLRDILQAGDS